MDESLTFVIALMLGVIIGIAGGSKLRKEMIASDCELVGGFRVNKMAYECKPAEGNSE